MKLPRKRYLIGLPALIAVILSASYLYTSPEDCGGVLGNKIDARIRSSSVRMLLDDPSFVAARFAPYAAMSALVYEEDEGCEFAETYDS